MTQSEHAELQSHIFWIGFWIGVLAGWSAMGSIALLVVIITMRG